MTPPVNSVARRSDYENFTLTANFAHLNNFAPVARRESKKTRHNRSIEPTPIKLTKNDQVNAHLLALMKAEKHDVIRFEFDRGKCTALVIRPYKFYGNSTAVLWELNHRRARKVNWSKLVFRRVNSLDELLDLLDET